MADGHVVWHWENPTNVTANATNSLRWLTSTLDTNRYGNFSCNVWLLRGDLTTDVEFQEYPAVMLAGNQNVYNNTIYWAPTESDIDIEGAHKGSHQLAWEKTADNPTFNVSLANPNFKGFSKGFNVLPYGYIDPSVSTRSSSSSSSTQAPTSTSTTMSLATPTAPSNITSKPTIVSVETTSGSGGMSQGAVIGLGVSLGCLAILLLAGGLWFWTRRYKKKIMAQYAQSGDPSPRYREEMPGTGVVTWSKPELRPSEMDGGWRPEEPREDKPQLP